MKIYLLIGVLLFSVWAGDTNSVHVLDLSDTNISTSLTIGSLIKNDPDATTQISWHIDDDDWSENGVLTIVTNSVVQTITQTNLMLSVVYRKQTNSIFLKTVGSSTNIVKPH